MSTNAALVGRLTRDPELRTTGSGLAVTSLRVAVDRVGDRQDDGSYGPGFFDVNAFGKTAENVCQYLSKGSQLAVFGRLKFHEWEAKDGSGKRSRVEIDADRVTFVGSKGDSDGQPAGDQELQGSGGDSDEDIPF